MDYQVKAVANGNEITTSSLKILVLSNPWRISVKNTDDTLIYKETATCITGQPMNECVMQPDEHFSALESGWISWTNVGRRYI